MIAHGCCFRFASATGLNSSRTSRSCIELDISAILVRQLDVIVLRQIVLTLFVIATPPRASAYTSLSSHADNSKY